MFGCPKPVWSIHCIRTVIIIGLNPQSVCQFSEFSFENTKPFCLTHPACHTALGPFQQPGPVLIITAAQDHAEQGILQVGLFPVANALCSYPYKKGLWGSHGLKHRLPLPRIHPLTPLLLLRDASSCFFMKPCRLHNYIINLSLFI